MSPDDADGACVIRRYFPLSVQLWKPLVGSSNMERITTLRNTAGALFPLLVGNHRLEKSISWGTNRPTIVLGIAYFY
jgi:hypothetical protein